MLGSDSMETFSFVHATAVAVGAFNTYIIHPQWLREVGIFHGNAEPEVQIDFEQPGLRLLPGGLLGIWIVRPDRLTVEMADRGGSPGNLVATVLEKLPWTPVSALGLNYVFEGETISKSSLKRFGFPAETTRDGYSVEQRSWHIALKPTVGSTIRNLQLSNSSDVSRFSVNFHTDTKSVASPQVLQILRQHNDNLKEATLLASELFGVQLV